MNKEDAYADRTIAAYRWRAKEAIANWSRHKPSRFLREFTAAVIASAESAKQSRVLDYGCGVGTELAWMRRNRLQAEGMDGTLEFVREARRRCPGVLIRFARFEKMEIPAGAYDGIWCNAALIHVPPTVFPRQLEKLRAGLKPGGLLGLTLAWGKKKGFARGDWIPGRYFASYTTPELKPLFKGWSIHKMNVVSKDGRDGRWIQVLASSILAGVFLFALAVSGRAESLDLDAELCEAVGQGDYSAAKVLLGEGARVDAICREETALMRSADSGYVKMVNLLLSHGATFNFNQPHAKETWIGLVGMEKLPIVDALLKTGADINYVDLQDDNGKTLLMAAAAHGDARMVRALLDRGAALEVKNKHGETALAIASEMRRAEVVQLLLEEGAQIDEVDSGRWLHAQ